VGTAARGRLDRGAVRDDGVRDARQVLDVDEVGVHVVAADPDGVHRAGQLGVPAGDELGRRRALAAGRVADGDPGEAERRVLDPVGLAQLVERGLAHRVGAERRPRLGERAGDRRQVGGDAARLGEIGDGRRGDQRRADDVGLEDGTPGARVEVDEAAQHADPGGVDERVDPAELRRGLVDGSPDGGLIGDVAGDGDGASLLRRVDQPVLAPSQQRHLRATPDEADPDGTS
jgi:hypothetical protein